MHALYMQVQDESWQLVWHFPVGSSPLVNSVEGAVLVPRSGQGSPFRLVNSFSTPSIPSNGGTIGIGLTVLSSSDNASTLPLDLEGVFFNGFACSRIPSSSFFLQDCSSAASFQFNTTPRQEDISALPTRCVSVFCCENEASQRQQAQRQQQPLVDYSPSPLPGYPVPERLSPWDRFIDQISHLPLKVQDDLINMAETALGLGRSPSTDTNANRTSIEKGVSLMSPNENTTTFLDRSPSSQTPSMPSAPPFIPSNDSSQVTALTSSGPLNTSSSSDIVSGDNKGSNNLDAMLLAIILPTTVLGALAVAIGVILCLRRWNKSNLIPLTQLPTEVIPEDIIRKGSHSKNLILHNQDAMEKSPSTKFSLAGGRLVEGQKLLSRSQSCCAVGPISGRRVSGDSSESLIGPNSDRFGSYSSDLRSLSVFPSCYDPHQSSLVRSCSGPNAIHVSTAGSTSTPLSGPRTIHQSVSPGRLIIGPPPRRSSVGPLPNSMDKVEEGSAETICLGDDVTHANEEEISGRDAEIPFSSYVHSDDRTSPLEGIVPSRDIVLGDKLGSGAFGTV